MKNTLKAILFVMMTTLLAFLTFGLTSCTDNSRTRNWGGTETVLLTPGKEIVNVTWKENDLWILTRQRKTGETIDAWVFNEKNSIGILEGSIILQEQ